MSRQELERDLLIVVCAISAGIHGGLVGEHLAESRRAGVGFFVATVLLSALVVALTHGAGALILGVAAVVLAGLIGSYALAITTGLPALHPQPEPVDSLAVATKVVEAVGLLAASHLLWRGRQAVAINLHRREGTLT